MAVDNPVWPGMVPCPECGAPMTPGGIMTCATRGCPNHVGELTDPVARKHDCKAWVEEGRGCAVCGNILRGLTGDDLANAAARTTWMNAECLILLDAAFRHIGHRHETGKRKGWWDDSALSVAEDIAKMLVCAGNWVKHDEGGFYRPAYEGDEE